MPDRRHHRGPHPEDQELFAPEATPRLRAAVEELSWLLTRGYADRSALALVGDRHQLESRQRQAVGRAACSDAALERRVRQCVAALDLAGRALLIDGFNVLTTVETALAGGVVLACRDGAFRDISGVHGTWRRVVETEPALTAVGAELARLRAGPCRWLLDAPVSNSGRLKDSLLAVAARHGWAWQVEVVRDPDALLAASDDVVATSDSGVLDRCARWFGLSAEVVRAAWILDLRSAAAG